MKCQILKVLEYPINNMRHQFHLFLTALTFYTRIPSPIRFPYHEDYLNQSTRYFPLIGWIVAIISFTFFYISHILLSYELSVCIALLAGVLTTGAFHEDGLADFFDGFGGGWTKDKILEIMKDSRVGTYGMTASIFMFMIKYLALHHLLQPLVIQEKWILICLIFMTYHSMARSTAIQLSFILPYVREDALSKVKPIAKEFSNIDKVGVLIFGLLPLIALSITNFYSLLIIPPLVLILFLFKNYLQKWIGGYTGDCLGAAEQIAESIILLSFVSIWKFM